MTNEYPDDKTGWYKNVVDTSVDGIYLLDPETKKILLFNQSFCTLLGYSPEEISSLTIYEIIQAPKNDIDNRISQLIQEQKKLCGERLYRKKNGETFPVIASATIFTISNKKFLSTIIHDITERKKQERELQKSEEKFRIITENIGDFILLVNERDLITFASPSLRRLGYNPDNLIGKKFRSFILPEDYSLLDESIIKVQNTFLAQTTEFRFLRNDSLPRVMETTLNWLVNDSGEWLIYIMRDITQRKQLEQKLKESEERFRKLAENAVDLIYRYEFTPKRGFTYVSPSTTFITGYTPEEHYADPDLGIKIVHPDDRKLLEDYFNNKGNFGSPIVMRWIRKDGTIIWTEQRNIPCYDSYGTLMAIEGIARDITKRKMAEEMLITERQLLRTIINNIPSTIYAKDLHCRKTLTNKKDLEYCGAHSESEVLGKDDFAFYPKEIAEQFYNDDQTVLRTGKPVLNREERIRFPDGSYGYLLTSKIPLFDENGNCYGLVGIGTDITERKKMEQEREQLLASLQQKNLEIEHTLEQLQQAQTGLIQAEKLASIGQLTAGIAHEINNPLAFVSSNLNRFDEYFHEITTLLRKWQNLTTLLENNASLKEYLTTLKEDEERVNVEFVVHDFEELMKHTREGITRIKNIVNQLRGFTHLASSQFAPANINEALEETILLVWNELKYNATLHKNYGNIPLVVCNIGELKQVFVNLLVNAAHALQGKGDIFISTTNTDSTVTISIRDTGCGIPPENLKRIFDPFFTTKQVGKGTGLGLWLVSTIIQKHHGTIEVQSEPGKGTEFIVTLPLGTTT